MYSSSFDLGTFTNDDLFPQPSPVLIVPPHLKLHWREKSQAGDWVVSMSAGPALI